MKNSKQKLYPQISNSVSFGENYKFLGQFGNSKGYKYDLGILANDKPAFAIVYQYQNMVEPQYISGGISEFEKNAFNNCEDYEVYLETYKRAKILNLI